MLYINEQKCTGCGICVDTCPWGAIQIVNDKAVIDVNKCTECRKCYDNCPQGAIYSESEVREEIPQNPDQIVSIPGPGIGKRLGMGRGRRLKRGHRKGRDRRRGGGGRRYPS